MGDYYNRTRSALSLTLPGQRSISVAPKSWVTLEGGDEGAPDVLSKITNGDLVPSKLNRFQESAPAPVRNGLVKLAPSPAPAPATPPVPAPPVLAAPSQEPIPAAPAPAPSEPSSPEPEQAPTSESAPEVESGSAPRKSRKGRS